MVVLIELFLHPNCKLIFSFPQLIALICTDQIFDVWFYINLKQRILLHYKLWWVALWMNWNIIESLDLLRLLSYVLKVILDPTEDILVQLANHRYKGTIMIYFEIKIKCLPYNNDDDFKDSCFSDNIKFAENIYKMLNKEVLHGCSNKKNT